MCNSWASKNIAFKQNECPLLDLFGGLHCIHVVCQLSSPYGYGRDCSQLKLFLVPKGLVHSGNGKLAGNYFSPDPCLVGLLMGVYETCLCECNEFRCFL